MGWGWDVYKAARAVGGDEHGPMTTATGRTTNESRAPFLPRLLADRKKSQRLWMPPESLLSPRRSPLDISPSHAHIRPPSRFCQPASLSLVSSGWLVYKNPVGRWTQSNSCFPLHLDRCWTCAIATLPPSAPHHFFIRLVLSALVSASLSIHLLQLLVRLSLDCIVATIWTGGICHQCPHHSTAVGASSAHICQQEIHPSASSSSQVIRQQSRYDY